MSTAARRPLPEQGFAEFAFTTGDFETIAKTLYDETGIHLPPTKATLVYSRIGKRLRALGLESFRDYCALVGGATGSAEKALMLAALTTNVTRFFREPHHFAHLRDQLLPGLLEAAQRGQRVRIWSAGCSSGQEPYSIALAILSLAPDARAYDIRILASDINPHVVAVGRRGVYSAKEVAGVPVELRRTWMEAVEGSVRGEFRLDDAVRGLVSFRELNLMGQWPMRGTFDAIFCRNVVIYFDEAAQARIWSRMLPLIAAGGFLYVGHAEQIVGPAVQRFKVEGTTTYRKIAGGRP